MRSNDGVLSEITDGEAGRSAFIQCPRSAIPDMGQYVAATSAGFDDSSISAILFPEFIDSSGFRTYSDYPVSWLPGTRLILQGPIGHGFSIPNRSKHIMLAALGHETFRLHPIIHYSLDRNIDVALFADCPVPQLPAEIEVFPLKEIVASISWCDFLAIDIPLENLDLLQSKIGFDRNPKPVCDTQILVYTEMPCAGLAECGVCAVTGRRKWKLTCKTGPVFTLSDLIW